MESLNDATVHVKSSAELNAVLDGRKLQVIQGTGSHLAKRLIVLEFVASWCGLCRIMSPKLEVILPLGHFWLIMNTFCHYRKWLMTYLQDYKMRDRDSYRRERVCEMKWNVLSVLNPIRAHIISLQ